MGVDTSIACKTCKKVYYLGYGGYVTQPIRVQKFPFQEHEGHDLTEPYSTDYLVVRDDGHLWTDVGCFLESGEDHIEIENYVEYEHIEL